MPDDGTRRRVARTDSVDRLGKPARQNDGLLHPAGRDAQHDSIGPWNVDRAERTGVDGGDRPVVGLDDHRVGIDGGDSLDEPETRSIGMFERAELADARSTGTNADQPLPGDERRLHRAVRDQKAAGAPARRRGGHGAQPCRHRPEQRAARSFEQSFEQSRDQGGERLEGGATERHVICGRGQCPVGILECRFRLNDHREHRRVSHPLFKETHVRQVLRQRHRCPRSL